MRAALALAIATVIGGCAANGDERAAERTSALYGTGDRWAGQAPHESRRSLPTIEAGADLDAYIRFGLENNAGLRASFDRWRSARERIPQVDWLPDPRLSYSHLFEPVETRTGPQRNRVMLSQTFPWWGKLDRRGEVEATAAEALWWRVEARRLEVIREIKRAFFQYGYLAQAIRITDEQLQLLRHLEPVVQRKVQAGAGQNDLLRLQVEIGKVENDLETLRALRPALSRRLDAALNRQGSDVLPWPKPLEARVVAVAAKELEKRVATKNPELEAIRRRVAEQERRTALAELEGWPDLTLGFELMETGSARIAGGRRGSGDDPFGVSLSLNVPIWRWKYRAAANEARAARLAAEGELRHRENALVAELGMRYYELDDAARRVSLYRDTLIPRARQSLELTEVAYQADRASLLDLIDSERVLLAFGISYWRAAANYEQSLADLEALTGGPIR